MEFEDDFGEAEAVKDQQPKNDLEKVEGPEKRPEVDPSKLLEESKKRDTRKEILNRAKKVKMEDRTAEWQSNYVSVLTDYEKGQYGTILARNKRLRDEMKVIVTAVQNVIVNEK